MSREIELSDAALKGNTALVRDILAEGYIDKTSNQMSALYNAAAEGHLDIVELLLDYGIDIDKKAFDTNIGVDGFFDESIAEFTPLVKACMNNHLEIVELLINRGANISVRQLYHGINNHALHVACSKGHNKIVALLLDQREIQYNPSQLLMIAAMHSRIDTLRFLVKRGFDINCLASTHYTSHPLDPDDINSYYTVLGMACESGAIDVIDFLLKETSVDVNQEFADGNYTPLLIACFKGKVDAVDRLLNHPDIQVNKLAVNNPINAFGYACFSKQKGIVNRLIIEGADVNYPLCYEPLKDGGNILMHLLKFMPFTSNDPEFTSMAIHLIENSSINLHQAYSDGKNVMDMAIECGNEEIITCLKARKIQDPRDSNTSSSSSSNSSYNPGFYQSSLDYSSSEKGEYYGIDPSLDEFQPDAARPKQ